MMVRVFFIFMMLWSFTVQAQVPICKRPITSAIVKLSTLPCNEAYEIALSIYRYTKQRDLDWRLVVAIIMQESTFRLDATNCKTGMAEVETGWIETRTCFDFGPTQINYGVWASKLNLSIEQLLSDWEYAIDIQTRILAKLKQRYMQIDPEFWWCRYHSNTSEFKHKYYNDVMRWFDQIDDE